MSDFDHVQNFCGEVMLIYNQDDSKIWVFHP